MPNRSSQDPAPPSVLERDCYAFNSLAVRAGYPKLRVEALLRVGIDPQTPLAQVPDEHLLRARGVGPWTVAEIRRVFPFEGMGERKAGDRTPDDMD